MSTIARPMTAEEFFEFVHLPENVDRFFELDEGEVVELSPPPRSRHGIVCANLAYLLGNYVRNRGAGILLSNDTGLLVSRDPDTVRGPDIAFHEGESDFEVFDELEAETGYSDAIPTLIIEVFSLSNRYGEVLRKVNQYLRGGVKLVWIVDPSARDVSVHRPDQEPRVLLPEDTMSDVLLPGFSCLVNDFFQVHKRRRDG